MECQKGEGAKPMSMPQSRNSRGGTEESGPRRQPWVRYPSGLARTQAFALLFTLFVFPGAFAADNELSDLEKKQGWVLLFDGKTLNGWMTSDGKHGKTPVEQESLNPHKSGHYMLVHTQQWSNFLLSLDFKITNKCNTGIFVRTASLVPRPGKDVGFNGIEIAIDDTKGAGFHDTGAIYDLVKPVKSAIKPAGEWNHIEIACIDSRIEVILNREPVTRADLELFTEPNKRPDGTTHKFDVAYKLHPKRGYIGLQDHGSPCWFKNIKLKPIPQSIGAGVGRL
jgi:hypothetical protein